MTPDEVGLRERKKRQTRQAIEDAAWRLFARQGYDETTVDDIAAAVDIAPRTFFRYFESKEAVLFGDWRGGLDDLRDRVLEHSASDPPLAILHAAMRAFSDSFESDRAVHVQRSRIAAESPHAGSYHRHVVVPTWEDTLTEALATVLDADPQADFRPRLYAGVAVAAVNAAASVWLADNGRASLIDLVSDAFDELATTTPPEENQR